VSIIVDDSSNAKSEIKRKRKTRNEKHQSSKDSIDQSWNPNQIEKEEKIRREEDRHFPRSRFATIVTTIQTHTEGHHLSILDPNLHVKSQTIVI
jgi:hypothetical protein